MIGQGDAGRIRAIDALRGLALLGVLIVNLDTEFRVTFFEQFSPHYATTADEFARALIGFLVEFKAITIFCMLFGVGLAIQAETLARRGAVARLLVRRLLVLLAFGLIHLLLIWNGDILTEYAVAGLVALPFVLGSARRALAASAGALLLFVAISMLPLPFPDRAWMARHVLEALAAYGHDGLVRLAGFRVAETRWIGVFDLFVFPRTVGLILLGAWAWKSGAIRRTGAGATRLGQAGWVGLASGLLLCWLDGAGVAAPLLLPPGAGRVVDVFAPIVLAVGYAALALRYVERLPACVVAWAAAVGRMAFTNYIAQSVVLGVLFNGYGFGLLGRVGVVAGVGISVALFAAQALVSRWWLRRHAFGPLEWVWRTGMYGRRQAWVAGDGGSPWR